MNPSASGVFFDLVALMKYGAMLRVLSLCGRLSVLSPDITAYPCNPDPVRITEINADKNVFGLMFIVKFY